MLHEKLHHNLACFANISWGKKDVENRLFLSFFLVREKAALDEVCRMRSEQLLVKTVIITEWVLSTISMRHRLIRRFPCEIH